MKNSEVVEWLRAILQNVDFEVEALCNSLGVSVNEEFRIMQNEMCIMDCCRINEEGITEIKTSGGGFVAYPIALSHLLSGTWYPIKPAENLILTSSQRATILYARACGCRWLAKDKNGRIYGYDKKPEKLDDYWHVSSCGRGSVLIAYSLDFLHWEDAQPFYIGAFVTEEEDCNELQSTRLAQSFRDSTAR